jgi:hypothetical protein
MVQGCEDEAAGRTIRDLERERDECLVGILQFLNQYRHKTTRHG